MHTSFHRLPLTFRWVDDGYEDLEPLFAADPVLCHVLVAMCPRDDYLTLFREIPTYLSLTWMSHLSESVKSVNKKEVSYLYLL